MVKVIHSYRTKGIRAKDPRGNRTLWWNGVGWTDEEEFAALYSPGRAIQTRDAIKALPCLQITGCSDPEIVTLR